jgi:hypothetical protein
MRPELDKYQLSQVTELPPKGFTRLRSEVRVLERPPGRDQLKSEGPPVSGAGPDGSVLHMS